MSDLKFSLIVEAATQSAEKALQRLTETQHAFVEAARESGDALTRAARATDAASGASDQAAAASRRQADAIAESLEAIAQESRAAGNSAEASRRQSSAADDAGRSAKRHAVAAHESAGALDTLAHSSTAARRELIVLAHELVQGNYSRFGGSLLVLGEQIDIVGKILSPTGLAVSAFAAAVAAAGYQIYEGAAEASRFNDAIRLTGDYAGVTAGQYRGLQESVRTATSGSFGDARTALQGLIESGRLSYESLRNVSRAVVDVARASHDDVEKVAADFAKIADGPAKFAAEANRQYHFLTLAQYEQIKALEESGRKQEAASLAAGILADRLEKQQKPLGLLPGLWKSLTGAIGDAGEALRNFGAGDTLDQQISSLQRRLQELRTVTTGRGSTRQLSDAEIDQKYARTTRGGAFNDYRATESQLNSLLAKRTAEQQKAQKEADDARRENENVQDRDRLESVREANAGRELELQRAHLSALAELQKAADSEERIALDAQLRSNQLSYADYYNAIAAIARRENAAQINELDVQLREIAEKRSAVLARPQPTQSGREEAQAKAGELDAQREQILGRIRILEQESANAQAEATIRTQESVEQLKRRVLEARNALEGETASTLGEREQAIAEKIRAQYAQLIDELKANGDSIDIGVVLKLEDTAIAKAQLQAQIDDIQRAIDIANTRFENVQLASGARVQTGTETQASARAEVSAATKVDRDALLQARQQVLDLLSKYPDDPKLGQILKTINEDVKTLGTSGSQALQEFSKTLETSFSSAFESILSPNGSGKVFNNFLRSIQGGLAKNAADGLGRSLSGLLTGHGGAGGGNAGLNGGGGDLIAKVGDSLAGLLKNGGGSIVNEVGSAFQSLFQSDGGSLISEIGGLLENLLSSFGGGGGGGGSGYGALFSEAATYAAAFFADGGYVGGSGHDTSDNVPSMLSPGEYVINSKAVRAIGVNALDAINARKFPRFNAAHFASGGLVGNAPQRYTAAVPGIGAGSGKGDGGFKINMPIDARGADAGGLAKLIALLPQFKAQMYAEINRATRRGYPLPTSNTI